MDNRHGLIGHERPSALVWQLKGERVGALPSDRFQRLDRDLDGTEGRSVLKGKEIQWIMATR
jgi:hypothetical protein